MANINALADSAIRLRKVMATHIGWPLIIKMTVQRSGTTFEPDVKRIGKLLRAELIKRGEVQAPKKTAAVVKKPLFTAEEFPDEARAAAGFNSWLSARKAQFRDEKGRELKISFGQLQKHVHTFIEVSFQHLPRQERPDVVVTEAFIRSAWAAKAARSRAKNALKKAQAAAKAAALGPEQGQLPF